MSNPIDTLYIRPLFYDALSAEFHPPSDPQRRAHTLGRLAYAGVLKGQREIINIEGTPYTLFSYQPSWAPNVLAKVDCEFADEEEGPFTLRAIDLDTSASSLYVADENFHGAQNIHIGTQEEDKQVPLSLGENLFQARLLVAQAAQTFFDGAV